MKRVVVTGLGMVSPLANGVETTWKRLLAGESGAGRVENFEVSDLACQIAKISPDEKLRKALRGGCMTAIVSPEGAHVVPPLTQGEGILIADLDMGLIVKRKRMMDSVGHYARPELLSATLDARASSPLHFATASEAKTSSEGDFREPFDRAIDQRTADPRRSAG